MDIGTGASIAFGTSNFTAEVMSINGNDISRPSIDSSHLGTTGARTFLPGDLVDNGSVELEINFDPDEQPPIAGAAETITVTFPTPPGGSTPADAEFSGFVTNWSWGVPLEDKMTATITLKISGAIAWTDSA